MTDMNYTASAETQKPARHRRSAKYAALDAQRQAAAAEAEAMREAAPQPETAGRVQRPVSGNACGPTFGGDALGDGCGQRRFIFDDQHGAGLSLLLCC